MQRPTKVGYSRNVKRGSSDFKNELYTKNDCTVQKSKTLSKIVTIDLSNIQRKLINFYPNSYLFTFLYLFTNSDFDFYLAKRPKV